MNYLWQGHVVAHLRSAENSNNKNKKKEFKILIKVFLSYSESGFLSAN